MTETLNWAIRETDFIFRDFEATVEERVAYVADLQSDGYPVLVAESDAGEYLGWALLHPYGNPRIWKGCVEDTIYLAPAAQGRGVGSALLAALIEHARADAGMHTILSLITGGNAASLALHQKFGFEPVGTFREVTEKFGRRLDLHHLQLMVG